MAKGKKSKDPAAEVQKRKDAMGTINLDASSEAQPIDKPHYSHKPQKSWTKPTTPTPKGPIQVVIAVEKVTDENIGFVLSQLRFYMFDARNYDNPGKYPFKVYETAWELGNVVKKKVAEFATKDECTLAFAKIKEAYAKDFHARYELIERAAPNPSAGAAAGCDYPAPLVSNRPVTYDPVLDGVPVPATQQQAVPRGPETTS